MVRKIEYDDRIKYRNIFGKLHRDDGPAIIRSNGEKKWYINGKLHRDDGPAIIRLNGEKKWYINGKLHREDGPAVIYPSGEVFWFLNHIQYTFREWCEIVNISDEEKMELVLRYG